MNSARELPTFPADTLKNLFLRAFSRINHPSGAQTVPIKMFVHGQTEIVGKTGEACFTAKRQTVIFMEKAKWKLIMFCSS